jgi:CheY-like chemotaxis protein/predicted regulator of Ras-like GTPase activity (Roadblock/LC7/MglB family)
MMLEHSNRDYQVSIAHSGEEALETLDRSPADLLVTDLRLPGITGLDLIRWVRASSPQTRTILITAYGNDEVEAEARRLEAYRYITKPFDAGDFTQTVQEALRDVAISGPGLTILSDESFEAIAQELESLRRDVGARCVFLADMQGQRLAEAGNTDGLDVAALLSLLAGGFATSGELARQFGSGQAINLNFHEGSRHEIYSANVGDGLFLIMVYDRRTQASRTGIVWFYTQRAIENLLSVLSTAEATAPERSLDVDFGDSLKAEMDTLFLDPTG